MPVLIVTVDAVVLLRERFQAESERAIRFVKESNSRKENFTVQQYLYTTVYYRRDHGESIDIKGWRATSSTESDGPIVVEFGYVDSSGEHRAVWEANLRNRTVAPTNDGALDVSWH